MNTTTPKPPGVFARMILALPVVQRRIDRLYKRASADLIEEYEAHEKTQKALEEKEEEIQTRIEGGREDGQRIRALETRVHDLLAEIENQKPKIQPAAGPLAADEVLDAYNVTEREPWFAATVQEVDGLIEDATRAVEEKPTAPASAEARTHAAGGLFALRDLRERLHALRDTATKREDSEDKAA